jgi:pilus assembly protein CpaF
MLLGRIGDATDLARLSQSAVVSDAFSQELERCAKEQAAAMRDEGEAPEGIDLDLLARDAHLELTQLGIVSTLLDDDSVTEIHIPRYDQVLAVRGQTMSPAELAFTSDEALSRAIRRIAAQTSHPVREGETIIERRHAKGSVLAVLPPTSSTSVLSIKKRRRVDDKLDDLLRQGRLSKQIVSLLEACVQGRANVLVAGLHGSAVSSTLAALAGAAPAGERLAVIYDTDEVHVPQAHVVSLAIGGDRKHAGDVVQAARKMQSARVVVTELGYGVCASLLESIAEGAQGVFAGITAPSLRQAVARLSAQVLLARPGVSQEGARELVAEAFDIGLEVQVGADGVAKIMRVAELNGTDPKGIVLRDIFATTGDGDFTATGVTPKVAAELTARGVKLDTSIFKRK